MDKYGVQLNSYILPTLNMRKSNQKLSGILIVSILASLALPIYIISFIDPSFSDFVARYAEQEATLIANHMARLVPATNHELDERSISATDKTDLAQMAAEFRIIKIKIYSAKGKIIYSTSPKDIGEINKHPYFFNIVAKGQTLSKVVKKNQSTMEGKAMPVNVIETYVPIFKHGAFVGAFEIYNDITLMTRDVHSLSSKSRNISISLAFLLLIGIITATKQAISNLAAQEKAEQKLQEAHDNLEIRVTERTNELSRINTALQEEIEVRQRAEQEKAELIEQLTKALDEVKTLSGLLPICAHCKQIRNDSGEWQQIEKYVQTQTDAEFTHGICPKCAKNIYPDIYQDMDADDMKY